MGQSNGGSNGTLFSSYLASVRSVQSETKLKERFRSQTDSGLLKVFKGDSNEAVKQATVVILGVDPADVNDVLKQLGLLDALAGKLVISIIAGLTREKLETLLGVKSDQYSPQSRPWVIRVLPNIAASVGKSLTAIEEPDLETPSEHLEIADAIFKQIGETVRLPARLMNAATAVGGSTPAFFAIICDSMIDAAVAVGVPRASAQTMIYQAMAGTAAILKSGVHPGVLKDNGTSPEGCTIGGVMVMEEGGVRGTLGKAVREAVTLARLMEKEGDGHVNDTRQ